MEIWLLLTVAGMVSSTPQIIILNERSNKEFILEGSTVDLHCRLWPNSTERCRVSWFFNSSGPFRTRHGNLSNQLAMTLTLHNVSQNNTGWYSCQANVEIPILQYKSSNWTLLEINKSFLDNTPTTYWPRSTLQMIEKGKPEETPLFVWSDWWMWIAVGVSGFVLVILLIVFLVLRRRQLKQRDLESPVYANMRVVGSRQPSPRARPSDHNTLKTESAYQNQHTPDVNKRYEHSRRLSPNR